MLDFELTKPAALLVFTVSMWAALTACDREKNNSEFNIQNSRLAVPAKGIYTGAYSV